MKSSEIFQLQMIKLVVSEVNSNLKTSSVRGAFGLNI